MPQNRSNIELRSEEVQEILGQMPRWIIRRGIALIFGVVFLLLVGSWFFRYPDIIMSKLILTTENPPAELVAKVNGKIDHLLVEDNQQVEAGSVLAYLENPANVEDIRALRSLLDQAELYFTDFTFPEDLSFSKNYRLGEVQASYASFLKQYSDYLNFLQLGYYARKVEAQKDQIRKYNMYYNRLYQQRNILEKELNIVRKQFMRDSLLYRKNVLSMADYQKSQKALLEQTYAFHGARTTLANTQISISGLEQEIMDLQLQKENETRKLQSGLLQAYDNLIGQLDIWEQKYLLRSPIAGTVSFNRFWSKNQQVKAGERVLTVLPNDSTKLVARLELPIQGAGKVKVGQRVNIKLDNYPYVEYGMLEGTIESISRVPDDQKYSLEVSLPKGMETNYRIRLDFGQHMEGMAEIITEDVRLLQRIFNPIKALFSKQLRS